MKSFKEKKAFYKERQELYDLAKKCKDENLRNVTVQGHPFDVSDRESANHVLLYCKRTKRPQLFHWYAGHNHATNKHDSFHVPHGTKAESSVLLWLYSHDFIPHFSI